MTGPFERELRRSPDTSTAGLFHHAIERMREVARFPGSIQGPFGWIVPQHTQEDLDNLVVRAVHDDGYEVRFSFGAIKADPNGCLDLLREAEVRRLRARGETV